MNNTILDTLIMAATSAGLKQIDMQRHATVAVDKGEGDYATDADIEGGKLSREIIQQEMPGTFVLAEEDIPTSAWPNKFVVMDDLDATKAFAYKRPDWGHNLGYVQNGVLTHAVIYLPSRKLLFAAEKGNGCLQIEGNTGYPVVLKTPTGNRRGLINIIFNPNIPRSFHDQVLTPLTYAKPEWEGVVCLNSNVGGIADVLMGNAVGFINRVGHIWDFVGALCVQEAGGVAIHPNGAELKWDRIPMSLLVAQNQATADEILAISKQYDGYGKDAWAAAD